MTGFTDRKRFSEWPFVVPSLDTSQWRTINSYLGGDIFLRRTWVKQSMRDDFCCFNLLSGKTKKTTDPASLFNQWFPNLVDNQVTWELCFFFFLFKCFSHDSFVQLHSVGCTPYTLSSKSYPSQMHWRGFRSRLGPWATGQWP